MTMPPKISGRSALRSGLKTPTIKPEKPITKVDADDVKPKDESKPYQPSEIYKRYGGAHTEYKIHSPRDPPASNALNSLKFPKSDTGASPSDDLSDCKAIK